MKIEIVKPVIPQFVADWIEEEKKCTPFHKSFARAISNIKHKDDWENWEYKVGKRWSRMLATAWLHGYEVEQASLYYAKVKGWELIHNKWDRSYWNLQDDVLHIDEYRYFECMEDFYKYKMTKEEWNKLGINDANADFEEVE